MSARSLPIGFVQGLVEDLGAERVRCDVPLARFTTFGVGGPADVLLELASADDIARVVSRARAAAVPVTVLGGGSNSLVSDAGVRGVLIRIHGGTVVPEGDAGARAEAGVAFNSLVRWTIGRGLAGLEAWAGTPGSVGGAIAGNAHYGGRSIGELVSSVRLLSQEGGDVTEVPAADLDFRYDHSRLLETREILLSALFVLEARQDPGALRAVARQSLAYRKRTQPLAMPSAGCVFQNPDPARDRVPDGLPWSAGALIDRAGLKGQRVGGACVSPVHANFIVNEGGATAADIRGLIARCRDAVQRQFGVTLLEEIRYLGF